MRLLGRKQGHCHSLPVGHGMICDETAGQIKGHCHSHTVGHGMRCDETAGQKKRALSLTYCSSWHKM
jgi:hypothetical protein